MTERCQRPEQGSGSQEGGDESLTAVDELGLRMVAVDVTEDSSGSGVNTWQIMPFC